MRETTSTKAASTKVPSTLKSNFHPTHYSADEVFNSMLPWALCIVWPLMSAIPLLLTASDLPTHYSNIFPTHWYMYDKDIDSPKPLGLTLGILAVAVGHLFLIPLFYLYRNGFLTRGNKPPPIQTNGDRPYLFSEGLQTHLSQPEGFVLLSLYLCLTWMLNLMPSSYYSFEGSIQWTKVFQCLVLQDALQYIMHRLEHCISPEFYKKSHKPHHRFTNPRLFDAFNGSMTDTICMILIPLFGTANIIRDANVWTYMAFGSMYANWLVLIHSEFVFPWDAAFRRVGFGTPGDHHVHHKVFKYNYGHLFMWFDYVGGTYRDPQRFAPKLFNVGS